MSLLKTSFYLETKVKSMFLFVPCPYSSPFSVLDTEPVPQKGTSLALWVRKFTSSGLLSACIWRRTGLFVSNSKVFFSSTHTLVHFLQVSGWYCGLVTPQPSPLVPRPNFYRSILGLRWSFDLTNGYEESEFELLSRQDTPFQPTQIILWLVSPEKQSGQDHLNRAYPFPSRPVRN